MTKNNQINQSNQPTKKEEKFHGFTRDFILKTFTDDLKNHPKAVYSDRVIIQMLKCLPVEFMAHVERARGGFAFNRGSIVECIIKSAILGMYDNNKSKYICMKSGEKIADLDTSHLDPKRLQLVNGVKSCNIEIKFSTSYAPATKKSNKARYTIIVNETGIYMIASKNLIYTPAGKLNINNQRAKDLQPLKKLMKLLGFEIDDDDTTPF